MEQVSHQPEVLATDSGNRSKAFYGFCGVIACITAGLLIYSQTQAFAWDEGFHLLTAQLIKAGRKPYLDFCFPQTPLNAYWNAFVMLLFTESWRPVHVFAALFTAAAVWLTADYVLRYFPVSTWRFAGALTAAILLGLNIIVVEYGTIGQAYGIGLFFAVAAFRLALLAVHREQPWLAALTGLFASSAAASTLLTAPVFPVLLIWTLVYNRAGSRIKKLTAFVVAAAIPFFPVLWLFLQGARQVYFNLFEFHLFFRRVEWDGATRHDLEVLTAWLDSSQATLLGLLAIAGLLYARFDREFSRAPQRRAEFYLCGWLSLALIAHLSTPHPTFSRYFIFTVPFLAILASVGLYGINLRLGNAHRTAWPVALLTVVVALGLGKSLAEERVDAFAWKQIEQIANKVDQVTPKNGTVWADEHIFFLTKRPPAEGMEFADSHKLRLPAPYSALLHIVPQPELERQIKAKAFDTAATCGDDEKIDALGLPKLYLHKADVADCTVFWGKKP